MARSHGKQTRVLVGSAHLSGSISGWRFEHRRLYGDVSNLLSDGEQWIPGQLAGTLTISGFFDADAGGIEKTFQTAATTDAGLLVTAFPETPAVGSFAFIAEGNVSARDAPSAVKDAVKLSITGTPHDGVDWGRTLHVLGAETATGNAASVDNAASSARGGVASLHVTAASGTTPSMTAVVQHSTDNSVFTDLITFTAATAATFERKTVSGTVNRFVRAQFTITGTTPSFTFAMVLARR